MINKRILWIAMETAFLFHFLQNESVHDSFQQIEQYFLFVEWSIVYTFNIKERNKEKWKKTNAIAVLTFVKEYLIIIYK